MAATVHADVVIVGGGLSGLTLACVLGRAGVDIACVDREVPKAQLKEAFDGRTTAISFASHRVLRAAGVWETLLPDAAPIRDIRVADGNAPLFLHFDCEDVGGAPFGWIIENRILRRRLLDAVGKLETVKHLAPAEISEFENRGAAVEVTLADKTILRAPLLVGADGRGSAVRKWAGIDVKGWSYDQSAIVCCVGHELDHENIAVEHFMPAGPFAILPMTDLPDGTHRSSLVWTEHGDMAGRALDCTERQFNEMLQDKFGGQLGRVWLLGRRWQYPLSLMHAHAYTAPRVALLGEAAHAIHPIAGQGLNLSMRDIAILSEMIVDQLRLGLDPASAFTLARYERWRKLDNTAMAIMTDGLNKLFSNDFAPVKAMRALGLGLVERIPPAKRFFMRQAMGVSGAQSRILRGDTI